MGVADGEVDAGVEAGFDGGEEGLKLRRWGQEHEFGDVGLEDGIQWSDEIGWKGFAGFGGEGGVEAVGEPAVEDFDAD